MAGSAAATVAAAAAATAAAAAARSMPLWINDDGFIYLTYQLVGKKVSLAGPLVVYCCSSY